MSDNALIILADVHANLPALKAVLKDIDAQGMGQYPFVVAGDIVSLGPQPKECLQLIQAQKDVQYVMGNCDRYVTQRTFEKNDHYHADMYKEGVPEGYAQNLRWTREQLSPDDISFMAECPKKASVDFCGKTARICHGSPEDDEEGIGQQMDLATRFSDADCYVFAHTHQPFLKKLDDRCYLNPGSVGSPLDGDTRASYAILHCEEQSVRVQHRRVDYDMGEIYQAMHEKSVPWEDVIVKVLRAASLNA